jgi:hypothetical protein
MISAFSDSCKTAPKAGVSIKQLYLLVSKLLSGQIKGLLNIYCGRSQKRYCNLSRRLGYISWKGAEDR